MNKCEFTLDSVIMEVIEERGWSPKAEVISAGKEGEGVINDGEVTSGWWYQCGIVFAFVCWLCATSLG